MDNRDKDSIHVIVPMDSNTMDLGTIQTDIAVIEEHLSNQDRILDEQNEDFESFKGKFTDFKEKLVVSLGQTATKNDIQEYKDNFVKQTVYIYGFVFTLFLAVAGWTFYWIESAAKLVVPPHH